MCYIPLFAVIFFFTENNKSAEFNKHVKYWIFLLITYIVLSFFLWWMFAKILWVLYIIASWFLWYKAYKWDNVDLEMFDNIEKTVKNKLNENDKNNKK
jgi:glucan phosphoethanolaminetransferase (alkaline phosphatase superfamily)